MTTTAAPADLAAARYALSNGWEVLENEYDDWPMGDHERVARECYDLFIGEVNWEAAQEHHDERINDGHPCPISADPDWCPHCTPGGTRAGTIAAIVDILDTDSTRPPLDGYPLPRR